MPESVGQFSRMTTRWRYWPRTVWLLLGGALRINYPFVPERYLQLRDTEGARERRRDSTMN